MGGRDVIEYKVAGGIKDGAKPRGVKEGDRAHGILLVVDEDDAPLPREFRRLAGKLRHEGILGASRKTVDRHGQGALRKDLLPQGHGGL